MKTLCRRAYEAEARVYTLPPARRWLLAAVWVLRLLPLVGWFLLLRLARRVAW
jgi:hypothetical protein